MSAKFREQSKPVTLRIVINPAIAMRLQRNGLSTLSHAEFGDCRQNRRLSPNSATVAGLFLATLADFRPMCMGRLFWR